MFALYVRSVPGVVTLEELIIYFQSAKSGGGDVDGDASKLNGNEAVIVFEKKKGEKFINLTINKRDMDVQGDFLNIPGVPTN